MSQSRLIPGFFLLMLIHISVLEESVSVDDLTDLSLNSYGTEQHCSEHMKCFAKPYSDEDNVNECGDNNSVRYHLHCSYDDDDGEETGQTALPCVKHEDVPQDVPQLLDQLVQTFPTHGCGQYYDDFEDSDEYYYAY